MAPSRRVPGRCAPAWEIVERFTCNRSRVSGFQVMHMAPDARAAVQVAAQAILHVLNGGRLASSRAPRSCTAPDAWSGDAVGACASSDTAG